MRSLVIYTMVAALFIGCKGKKDVATYTSEDGKTTTSVNVSDAKDIGEEMNKKMEELKKLPPMSIDELKKMLPETLLGMKRNNFNATSAMGFASGEAEYKKDDTSSLKLTIFDCAGEAGSAFYSVNYWTKMQMESQNDDGFVKTVDFMGGKAVEDYKKNNSAYTLSFPANDRLMVILSGEHIPLSSLEDAAKALNLKAN